MQPDSDGTGRPSENGTEHVGEMPRRTLYGAIGAEDGQCAYFHPGIDARCTNDAAYHTFTEQSGEWEKVEICEEHVRSVDTETEGSR